MNPEVARNPQPIYSMLQASTPIFRLDGVGVIVTSRSGVDEVLRDPETFSSGVTAHDLKAKRPLIPLQIDPPDHRKYRKLLDPLFAPQRVKLLEDSAAQLVHDLIDAFGGEREIDFCRQFSTPFPSQVFLTLFGLPLEELPRFLTMKDGAIRPDQVVGRELGHPETEAYQQQIADSIYAYFEQVIDEPARQQRDDLISHFLHVDVDGDRLTTSASCSSSRGSTRSPRRSTASSATSPNTPKRGAGSSNSPTACRRWWRRCCAGRRLSWAVREPRPAIRRSTASRSTKVNR